MRAYYNYGEYLFSAFMPQDAWVKPSQMLSELLSGERVREAIIKTMSASFFCNILLAPTAYARDLRIKELYLCKDFDRDKYECNSTVFVDNGATFKISETPYLYLMTSVESEQERRIVHAWHFAGRRISQDMSHTSDVTYWDDERRIMEKTIPVALAGFLERLVKGNLGEAISFVSLTISPSPAYHTYSIKEFNESHVGPWSVRVLDRSSGEVKRVVDFEMTE